METVFLDFSATRPVKRGDIRRVDLGAKPDADEQDPYLRGERPCIVLLVAGSRVTVLPLTSREAYEEFGYKIKLRNCDKSISQVRFDNVFTVSYKQISQTCYGNFIISYGESLFEKLIDDLADLYKGRKDIDTIMDNIFKKMRNNTSTLSVEDIDNIEDQAGNIQDASSDAKAEEPDNEPRQQMKDEFCLNKVLITETKKPYLHHIEIQSSDEEIDAMFSQSPGADPCVMECQEEKVFRLDEYPDEEYPILQNMEQTPGNLLFKFKKKQNNPGWKIKNIEKKLGYQYVYNLLLSKQYNMKEKCNILGVANTTLYTMLSRYEIAR